MLDGTIIERMTAEELEDYLDLVNETVKEGNTIHRFQEQLEDKKNELIKIETTISAHISFYEDGKINLTEMESDLKKKYSE